VFEALMMMMMMMSCAGSDGTHTSIHGGSSAVQTNSSSGAGVYSSLQQLQDGVSNVGGPRPSRPADTGIYRPSPYGPRAPPPKTGQQCC